MNRFGNYKSTIMGRHPNSSYVHSQNLSNSINGSGNAFQNYMIFKELDRDRLLIHRNDADDYANKVAEKAAEKLVA